MRTSAQRIAAGLALLAVLLHATLVPWHAGARHLSRQAIAQLDADLAVLCHGGRTPSPDEPAHRAPRDRTQDCPVCLGLAAAELATAADPAPVPARSLVVLHSARPLDSGELSTADVSPRSRGPPIRA